MRLFIASILFLWYSDKLIGQSITGARSYAMGGSSTAVSGHNTILGNPALERNRQFLSSFFYLPGLPGLNRMAFAAHWNQNQFRFESGIQRCGDLKASIDRIYVGLSHVRGSTSLGMRFNLNQFKAEQFNTSFQPTISIGGVTRFGGRLTFGAWIDQLTIRKHFSSSIFEQVRMEFGFSAEISPKTLATALIQSELDKKPILKVGLDCQIARNVNFRAGNTYFPTGIFGGLGFKYWLLSADLSASFRPHEGAAIQITSGYRFNLPNRK